MTSCETNPPADSGITKSRKGVSFLSRILAPGKSRNRGESVVEEDDDEAADYRPEGMDAQLFSHSADNVGFSPRHPQPPGYIKFRARFKKERDFDRVFLAQELRTGRLRPRSAGGESVEKTKSNELGNAATVDSAKSGLGRIKSESDSGNDAIWALEFSKDGKYLAAAGQDKIVRVWSVISSREERRMHEKDEENSNGTTEGNAAQHLSAPVFRRNPLRVYEGHASTVIDISWSKNNFLLSSSFDRTVRLWHISRNECLVTFKHAEYCPSVQFHPRDDRFFLAGSLDTKLRLWSIPDKSVAFWNQLPEIITAVSFTPDGKTAIAGTMGGTCHFYDTDGLKYKTQINIKSSGRNAKPAKITSIQSINWGEDQWIGSGSTKGSGHNFPYSPTTSLRRDVKLLISSNDSRIRLYNFRDKSLEMKFKAHKNVASQIRASFSDDSRFIISGSEDRKTYIWGTGPSQEGERQRPLEVFEAHNTMTTGAILAPRKTRMALSASEDPVFDICNPPPVTLISRSESVRTGSNASGTVPIGNGADPSGSNSVQATPATAESNGTFKRAEESPAYLARTAHVGGNIIVTADYAGNIKVFRQDCAYGKRKGDLWSDAASVFSRHSRRLTGIGRSTTRGSVAGSVGSSRSRAGSTATQPPGERILNWRQSVTGTGTSSSAAASTGSLESSSMHLRARPGKGNRERSASPRKSFGAMSSASTSVLGQVESRSSLRNALSLNRGGAATPPPVAVSSPDLSITAPTPTSPVRSGRVPEPTSLSGTTLSSTGSGDGATPTMQSPLASSAPLMLTESPEVMRPDELQGSDNTAPKSASEPVLASEPTLRPQVEQKDSNPLWLQSGHSYIFWNTSGPSHNGAIASANASDTNVAQHMLKPPGSGPQTPGTELAPQVTAVSTLSSERGSSLDTSGNTSGAEDGDRDGAADARPTVRRQESGEGEGELKCRRCGSTSFRARVVSGGHRLVCQRCGTPA